MKINRKVVAIAAVVAVVAAGGVGIAYAVGGGDAEKAKSAAIDAAGGGTVLEAEYQEAGSAGFYEVEVERPDGSVVEVHVDGQFQPVGTAADDDSGAEDESTEGAEDE
jgi:Peptidase propeptide and YPEB domain